MDYDHLLNLAAEVGYELQLAGAEVYRVEESVQLILAAYGVDGGEVFAIPNCINVGITTPDGRALTRIRRVPLHGTDIYRLEALNALSRRVCAQVPPLEEAEQLLADIRADRTHYSSGAELLAYAVSCAAFALFWGGNARDAVCAAACGVAIGFSQQFMSRLRTNLFFQTCVGACLSGVVAVLLMAIGVGHDLDIIIIGALMMLVPGVSITNAMRDIIAGDMLTGITKTAESILIGVAIALGTAVALLGAPLLGVIA